jgi:hypothetical protein
LITVLRCARRGVDKEARLFSSTTGADALEAVSKRIAVSRENEKCNYIYSRYAEEARYDQSVVLRLFLCDVQGLTIIIFVFSCDPEIDPFRPLGKDLLRSVVILGSFGFPCL